MTTPTRQRLVQHQYDIESMIEKEDDPKQRAFLIVLNGINNSLIANTDATREIKDALDSHMENFERESRSNAELLNKGRGAYKVVAWVLGIGQILATGAWMQMRQDISELRTSAQISMASDARHDARISALEAATRTNKP